MREVKEFLEFKIQLSNFLYIILFFKLYESNTIFVVIIYTMLFPECLISLCLQN